MGAVWLTLGSFDDPKAFTPQLHMYVSEELPWAHTEDDTPRYEDYGPA